MTHNVNHWLAAFHCCLLTKSLCYMPSLEWLNKSQAVQAATKVTHHLLSVQTVHGDAASDNLLIQGDNLQALKALLSTHRGRLKCIFIDPPYNTQSAFAHYNDKLEHSLWLTMMYPRLVLLRELLTPDGSIWVIIDDNEGHYLKVLMDEIFLRENFVANVVWQKKYAVASDAKGFSDFHDHIYVYSKAGVFHRNLLPRTDKQDSLYKHDDHDGNGPWRTDNLSVKTYSEAYNYPLRNPKTEKEYWPPKGRCWYTSAEKMLILLRKNGIYFGKDGNGAPQLKRYLARVQGGVVPSTWWTHEDAGHNDESRKESKVLFDVEDPFSTPKPERLLQRILNIATNPGDIVLDSFLGSGTTAAVAHKMGRRWIGIEMGPHAITHCIPRMEKVIAGEQGGISKAVNWQGGGGFKFLTLGNPVFNEFGHIHNDVKFADMAAFVWQQEIQTPATAIFATPFLGEYNGTAYYLLFNGILGDKRPEGGNVLTYSVVDALKQSYPFSGPRVVYGEARAVTPSFCTRERLTFKKIPYSLRGQGAM